MKHSLIIHFLLIISVIGSSQTPQIAVVRPNGTTFICTTFDSAYSNANDDDFLYLPGGHFTATNPIDKRIHIYGAGYYPDSSVTTGITTLNNVILHVGAEDGSITGLRLDSWSCDHGSLLVGDALNLVPFSGFTLKTCWISGGLTALVETTDFAIINCYIGNHGCGSPFSSIEGSFSNSILNNSFISYQFMSTYVMEFSSINNNIFIVGGSDSYPQNIASNSTYENNIFKASPSNYYAVSNSIFTNNCNGAFSGTDNIFENQVQEPIDSTFVTQGPFPNGYHVKTSSLCYQSGTDGTDRGIYGGAFPNVEGAIPENPHVYFKQIDQVTGSDGRLHIQVGVRMNDD